MTIYLYRMQRIVVMASTLAALALGCGSVRAQPELRPRYLEWISRPWEMRYFIYVDQHRRWKHSQALAAKFTSERDQHPDTRNQFWWQQYFEPASIINISHWNLASQPELSGYPKDLAVVVIQFDKDGFVTTPHSFGRPLRGRLNNSSTMAVMLSAGDEIDAQYAYLDWWYLAHREDTPDGVTPALCNPEGLASYAGPRDDNYVYGDYYQADKSWLTTPPFNCREWSWQMHEAERPYIDVTSYGPPDSRYKKNYPHGTYIQEFVGWSRFDRQKPVIGKHADKWYCLHECPQGEAPGEIADIKAWAAANGWPVPKPPTRMPVFTDDPRRRGYYPD
ncbi:hypothetical protein [uncultured Aquincola sp.]|uniref:hypothetical protein n=1 Tax=uncultured Aquincola sp. TaxID=886556 RepID=UPI0032B21075